MRYMNVESAGPMTLILRSWFDGSIRHHPMHRPKTQLHDVQPNSDFVWPFSIRQDTLSLHLKRLLQTLDQCYGSIFVHPISYICHASNSHFLCARILILSLCISCLFTVYIQSCQSVTQSLCSLLYACLNKNLYITDNASLPLAS